MIHKGDDFFQCTEFSPVTQRVVTVENSVPGGVIFIGGIVKILKLKFFTNERQRHPTHLLGKV